MRIKSTSLNFAAAAILLISGASLSSCTSDDDPVIVTVNLAQTPIEYDSEGLWTGAYTDARITSQFITFSHQGEIGAWGPYSQGFVASRSSQNAEFSDMIAHQYDCIAAGGAGGKGTPFLLGNWNSSETADTPLADRSCYLICNDDALNPVPANPFIPVSVKVCNSSYAYYTMLNGNAFSRKFEEGDYFTITAHGITQSGPETESTFYLANCKGDPANWFVTEWTDWDLSALGNVIAIYFTMESSDTGQWGMNTPGYFCLDRFRYETIMPGN